MEKKGKEINSWRKLRKKGDLKYKNFERKSGNLWYKNNEKKKKIKKLYEKGVLGIDAALYRLKFLYLNEYQKKKPVLFVRNGELSLTSSASLLENQKDRM